MIPNYDDFDSYRLFCFDGAAIDDWCECDSDPTEINLADEKYELILAACEEAWLECCEFDDCPF